MAKAIKVIYLSFKDDHGGAFIGAKALTPSIEKYGR